MRLARTLAAGLPLCVAPFAAAPATPQGRLPEIPKRAEASNPGLNVSNKTVHVLVTSRRPEDPDPPADLEHLKQRVEHALPSIPLRPAPDPSRADLLLELIVEPHLRYGEFHSQNAPYLYLTLREQPDGPLVYCAYQRAGHIVSASGLLLRQLKQTVQHPLPNRSQDEALGACAAHAKRPL